VSDLAALCKPRWSSRRGKPFKWNKAEGTAANTTPHRDNETKTTDLKGVHLVGVYLTGVHLTGVHLKGVHLMGRTS